jgi:hypothetical protein
MALIIAILVFVLVAGVLWWAVNALVGAFGIPNPLATIIQVVVILILLLAFLDMTGIFGGGFCGGGGFHLGSLR